jgi:predicted NAD-dependent protein-ADP-ribosyltransferase YbiA (DUF1768 family)
MPRHRRTYRDVGGVRVEGTWRPVFTRNGNSYALADLIIYADGVVDFGTGMTTVDGLREAVADRRVLSDPPPAALLYVLELGHWQIGLAESTLDMSQLLGEVADELDRLNGRPDSGERCKAAAIAYVAEQTEANRLALRAAYDAIPTHLRDYALQDMDVGDWPLRILATPVGEHTPGPPVGGRLVTEQLRADMIAYFETELPQRREYNDPKDGPETARDAPLIVIPTAPPQPLQNVYPAAIVVDGREYRSVVHAYWALSTSDTQWHDRIAAVPEPYAAERLARESPRWPHWPAVRLAVMATLLRAKYGQHRELAQALLATGDAHIVYVGFDSAYWTAHWSGTNWIGRLLEVVRSELAAEGLAGHKLAAEGQAGRSQSAPSGGSRSDADAG